MIVSCLRRLWLWSVERQQALQAGRISRGKYACAECHKLFSAKSIQVDHKNPMGKFMDWDIYINKLFCRPDQLQLLCKPCHAIKTKGTK